MRILAIESSCDETAVAVLTGEGESVTLEKSLVRSQIDLHKAYGGVVPEVAAREHLETLLPMVKESVARDGAGIDVIAVTAGPGLPPGLRVGVEVAKTLAVMWNKPLVPVCHMEGHMYAPWLSEGPAPAFPLLALTVAGGHTELVLMYGHGQFERLGETIDDAAGEAFDKVAKMLGLPYPGGPEIAKLAEGGDVKAFDFPRALMDREDLNFSFAGLKTSVLYTLRNNEALLQDTTFRRNIAASFQEAVVDVLTKKTQRAVAKHAPKSIVLAGGVAANIELRKRLAVMGDDVGVPVYVPKLAYALDNAAMIAVAGYFRARQGRFADPLTLVANPSLDIV